VLRHPDAFTRTGIETENSLVNDRFFGNKIAQVNLSIGNDRGGKTVPDRRRPFWNQAGGRKSGKETGLGPGAIPFRSAPLRPISGNESRDMRTRLHRRSAVLSENAVSQVMVPLNMR
jgi:hypothetical protein